MRGDMSGVPPSDMLVVVVNSSDDMAELGRELSVTDGEPSDVKTAEISVVAG